MVTFQVPLTQQGPGASRRLFRFSVPQRSVLLAGSRYQQLPHSLCSALIEQFHHLGFGYYVGCAGGVDRSFREALAVSPYCKECFVACAFSSRLPESRSLGLFCSVVVPKHLPPKAALYRRTLWMVRRCSLVVVFPQNPYDSHRWGKGSRLVFRSAVYHLRPMFVVSDQSPPESVTYRILPSNLFGVLDGYWVVPHPFEEGGVCEDEL